MESLIKRGMSYTAYIKYLCFDHTHEIQVVCNS